MGGIVLSGGTGSRLFPATIAVSKQILPVYDKPMIYYPLSTLMLAEIRDILIISTIRDIPIFKQLLGTGEAFGLNLSYAVQAKAGGIAEAFLIGESFLNGENVCLILGDNLFYGHGLSGILKNMVSNKNGATIFGYHVANPSEFGVVAFDYNNNVTSIEEKPQHPKSNYAVTGLYFYDKNVSAIAKDLKPSSRGELEITDINNVYLKNNQLKVEILGRGVSWLDTGTPSHLLSAAAFVEAVQTRQGLYISCLEEIAYRKGWITADILEKQAKKMGKTAYGKYLESLL